MKPEEIYILDRWRIAESDFIIMNLDSPSFGVGQEAEIACSMGIPIIAFHYAGNDISRMIRGVPAIYSGEENTEPSEGVIAYNDIQNYDDLKGHLIAKVRVVQKHVKFIPSQSQTIEAFSTRLRKAIDSSRKSEAQVAREAGFTEAFLRALLKDYKSIESIFEPYGLLKLCKLRNIPQDRYLNPGLWVLRNLAETLNTTVSALIGEQELDRIWHEPLYYLSDKGVSLREFADVSDKADYLIMYQKAARTADKGTPPQEVAEHIFKLVEARRNERSK